MNRRLIPIAGLYFAALFLIGLTLWTHRYFGMVSVGQAISTINFDVEGTLSSDSIFITRFIKWCLLWPAIITLCLIALQRYMNYSLRIPLVLLFVAIGLVGYQYRFIDFIRSFNRSGQDYFATQYVDPRGIAFSNAHPKSLVLIYVESLETSYADTTVFDHDLLHALNKLPMNTLSFRSFRQLPDTGWTIAGMVGTQCGIPLKSVTIFNGNRLGENLNHYLPGAVCLSDILAAHGYRNVFMKGAALRFAGVNNFLADHHYHEMLGREQWLLRGFKESQMNGWGLTDYDLFAEAKKELAKLIDHHKPFNLTILTVDTHGYEGSLSQGCRQKGYQDFPGIVECTVDRVADFVRYIQQQGWFEQLDVVVLGDHLAMQNPVYDKLTARQSRTIFNLIITKDTLRKNTDEVVHFDFLPTILDLLGFRYAEGKVGLGYSAIRSSLKPLPTDRFAVMQEGLSYESNRYALLWKQHNG